MFVILLCWGETMEKILSGSIFLIYIWWMISLYNNKSTSQKTRISQAYFLSIALRIYGDYSALMVVFVMISALFLCEEYFNPDSKKPLFVRKLRWKAVDFCYLYLFLYKVAYPILGILLYEPMGKWLRGTLWIEEDCASDISKVFVCLVTLFGVHRLYTERIEFKPYSEVLAKIEETAYYKLYEGKEKSEKDDIKRKFKIIAEVEDRYFFKRSKYTFVTLDQIKLYCEEHGKLKLLKRGFYSVTGKVGHSTIEMQLLRILFFERGLTFDGKKGKMRLKRKREIIFRKIFEVCYTPCFFSALRDYVQSTATHELTYFKDYIMMIYLNNALTKINGQRYDNVSQVIDNIEKCDLELLFVAALGLNTAPIDEERIHRYDEKIVFRYKLNMDRIEECVNEYGNQKVHFSRSEESKKLEKEI